MLLSPPPTVRVVSDLFKHDDEGWKNAWNEELLDNLYHPEVKEAESFDHLFLECQWSRALWFMTKWNIRVESIIQEGDFITWVSERLEQGNLKSDGDMDFLRGILMVASLIWDDHNARQHGRNLQSHEQVLNQLKQLLYHHTFNHREYCCSILSHSCSNYGFHFWIDFNQQVTRSILASSWCLCWLHQVISVEGNRYLKVFVRVFFAGTYCWCKDWRMPIYATKN